jgi:GNAT superfamily N-acetyltransferase
MTEPTFRYCVVNADLENEAHETAILEILDEYASDPVITGQRLDPQALERVIPGLRDHPTCMVFLAFEDELAVGFSVCFRMFSTFAGAPFLNVHDFAARATHRRRGVGRCLLATIEERARALGCCKLTLEVNDGNEPARQLYQSVGFRNIGTTKLYWEKPLG